MSDWGSIQLGRNLLRETFTATEQGGDRSLDLDGQESTPPLTRAVLTGLHDNLNAMEGDCPAAVTFTDKPERNGYYQVKSNSSTLTEYRGDSVTADWKASLSRLGAAGEVDLQSRLTGVVRLNDFSLTGERWHAPAIGHFGYYTGATSPTVMTRATADGTITVYRGVPAGVPPRWGCDPTNYLKGRVRVTDTAAGLEVDGTERRLPATAWALSNGLVNVTPTASGGVIDVQAWTGGAWHSKLWNITVAGTNVPAWDSASILRNDLEHAIVRLTASRSPGRVTLDLALRRGARTVEGYLQSGSSAALAVYLRTLETNTSAAASGYVTASGSDADGNRFACGSARTFTAHTNGGVTKTGTALDFWLGVVAGQPTLNANPTFETNTSDWIPTNATLARSSIQAKYGGWSGLLTSTAGASPRAESGQVAAVAGASYRASGWIFAPSALTGGVEVDLNWFDASHGYLSTAVGFAIPTVGAWQFYDQAAAAPVGAAFVNMTFTMSGSPGAGMLLYGDDLRLSAATPSGDAATDLRNQYVGALAEATYAVRR